MTLEELKIEAKNQGYKLIKDTPYEKFLPCKCGHNRRKRYYGFYNMGYSYRYMCMKCGYYVDGKTEKEAKHNWNEKMRGDGMTREEARKRLEVYLICAQCPEDKECYDSSLHSTCEYNDCREEVSLAEAIRTAIKALEQEPCEDAISRQEVLNQIFYSTDNSGDVVLGSVLRRRIDNLPSVRPQEPELQLIPESKQGWAFKITIEDLKQHEEGYWIRSFGNTSCECSKCGGNGDSQYKYCPWCGEKKMR